METTTGGEVEAWLEHASGGNSEGDAPTCTRVQKKDKHKKCVLSDGSKCTHNYLKKNDVAKTAVKHIIPTLRANITNGISRFGLAEKLEKCDKPL